MSLKDVRIGANAPEKFNMILECVRGDLCKYEYDKDTDVIALDRVNPSSIAFPCGYGMIPDTLYEDGDALDVILLYSHNMISGIVLEARPIGVMYMNDGGENDEKIICVPTNDRRMDHIKDIDSLNEHYKKELKHFFEHYKDLKDDTVVKVGEFKDKKDAIRIVEKSIDLFNVEK